jgi:DNA-binding transcriptional MerR regulator
MTTINETPTFNLKAVIQETGLKPDTLRAWERRYGLPQPQRTSGGHRLYSQHDIDMLKWLIARQDEGLSISRAVALWRQLEAEGQDPLQDPNYGIPDTPPVPAFLPEGDAITDIRQAWLDACLRFDEQEAEQVLTYALALYPAEMVCFEILLRGLANTGEGWYAGKVTVQQEHFVSELSMRRLEALVAATPPPTRAGRVLVGCAPEDSHTFAPLLLTYLLKQRGWDVLYLGARVPASRLESAISTAKPHLVILTAQQLYTAATLLETAETLAKEQVPLAFGGRVFNVTPVLQHYIPGHFLGEKLEAAPQMVEHLLTTFPPAPPTRPISDEYQRALEIYRRRQTLVEAEMWHRLDTSEVSANHLTIANTFIARNITAALSLGNIELLRTDITWIEGLLEHHDISPYVLKRYLRAYLEAARLHLDQEGDIVVHWLAQLQENSTSS